MSMNNQEQIKKLSEEEQKRIAFAKSLKDILKLFDPEHIRTKTTSTYSRESLRTYLRNPATDSNNKNLRKLSNYLYTVSHIYRRMVNFKAHQIQCKSWEAWPIVNMSEENDEESVLKEYDRVTKIVHNMHMETQIYKIMLQAWKNGVSYGYIYGNPENDDSFYIHLLDPDYCKISCAAYDQGVFGIVFDMSYFNTYSEQLEYYDKEFQKLYNEYNNDKIKWKQLPIERTICIKIDPDNLDYSIPPMSGLLEQIISITDLQAAQNEVDELNNYKMVWGKLNTLKGSNVPNDFEVDLDLAIDFMNKVNAELPDSVGYALSPLDLNTIEFKDDSASDTNTLSKAYSNLIEANGSIVLNSNRITNSTAFKMAVQAEVEDAMAPVTQLNAWLKFYLKYNHNVTTIGVEFSDISPYFLNDEIDKVTKLCNLGMPLKLRLASLTGETAQRVNGSDYLERQLLGLGTSRWNNPLVSASVQSGNPTDTGGAPTAEEKGEELSPEGEASRDKDTNQK